MGLEMEMRRGIDLNKKKETQRQDKIICFKTKKDYSQPPKSDGGSEKEDSILLHDRDEIIKTVVSTAKEENISVLEAVTRIWFNFFDIGLSNKELDQALNACIVELWHDQLF